LLASCGEENLLKLIPDRYHGRDICVHEFAHTILNYGLCETVREHVVNHYKWSMHKGLWEGCYAATNYDEFFAELSMWYFGTTGDPGLIDPPPNKGAAWFRNYDPASFAVLDDIFSGRSRITPVEWQRLSSFSADLENNMVSQSSSVPTKIRIVNESPIILKIYWLNYQGERVFTANIAPGESFFQLTFATHPWLLTDVQERGISIYTASDLPDIAVINELTEMNGSVQI
jgi:hypothetical protein